MCQFLLRTNYQLKENSINKLKLSQLSSDFEEKDICTERIYRDWGCWTQLFTAPMMYQRCINKVSINISTDAKKLIQVKKTIKVDSQAINSFG